jgi:D-alanyl-D-alanine carboxypeptidase (penicillin-binding protein 5/6)
VAALLTAPVVAAAAPTAVSTEVVGGPDLAAPGIVVRPGPGTSRLPTIDADTWLLADLTTGQVLAAKGAHTKVLPASTLKTLTAVTLMPKLDKKQVVTATYEQAKADGGHVGIVPGATYSVWDLWHGLLLPSANDAAAALADANGGMTATVRDMQAMAESLQANDTTVKNDSGLDAKGQVSSAYDMALFARAALAIPDFAQVTKTFHYSFPGRPVRGAATRKTYQIYTQNRLLVHGYKGVLGGKTGFTSLAHRTYWGAASRGGHVLVVTLFQIHEPTETAAKSLLNWGFANLTKVTPVGTLVGPRHASSPDSTAPAASATPSQAAAGGGTTASGGSTASASTGAPWKPIALVVALVGLAAGAVLWWRRRRPAHPDPSPTSILAASTVAPAAPRPVNAAARTSPSVVVSGRHRADAGVPPAAAPTAEAAAVETPAAETPVTVAPTVEAPADGSSVTEAPVAETPVAERRTGGHVRIITPPGRTPEA